MRRFNEMKAKQGLSAPFYVLALASMKRSEPDSPVDSRRIPVQSSMRSARQYRKRGD